jgi:hypothetical protein
VIANLRIARTRSIAAGRCRNISRSSGKASTSRPILILICFMERDVFVRRPIKQEWRFIQSMSFFILPFICQSNLSTLHKVANSQCNFSMVVEIFDTKRSTAITSTEN